MNRSQLEFATWYAMRLARFTNSVRCADDVMALIKLSRTLHRLAEIACERAWTPAETKRDYKAICEARRIIREALPAEYTVKSVDDPRAGVGLVICGPGETYHGDGRGYRVPRLVVYLAHLDRCVRYQRPTALP